MHTSDFGHCNSYSSFDPFIHRDLLFFPLSYYTQPKWHATSSCPSPKHHNHQHGIAKPLSRIHDLTRFRCYSLSLSLLGTRLISSYHSSSLHAMSGWLSTESKLNTSISRQSSSAIIFTVHDQTANAWHNKTYKTQTSTIYGLFKQTEHFVVYLCHSSWILHFLRLPQPFL